MISIRINEVEHNVDEVTESWIAEQIHIRREAGEIVCVGVRIDLPGIKMRLATPTCGGGGGGGRPPNQMESRLFALWAEQGLDGVNFSPKAPVLFLRSIAQLN